MNNFKEDSRKQIRGILNDVRAVLLDTKKRLGGTYKGLDLALSARDTNMVNLWQIDYDILMERQSQYEGVQTKLKEYMEYIQQLPDDI